MDGNKRRIHTTWKLIKQIMSKIKNPWDLAYELNKEYYSRADIDDMLFCEIEELINQE